MGVTDLRDGFFRWCRTLTSVIFSGPAPTVVGSNVFDGLPEEAVVIVSGEEHASFGDVGADWNGLSIVCNSSALCWLTWTMTDGEVSITDCNEAATGELVIPDTIGGNPVTSIGDAAFADWQRIGEHHDPRQRYHHWRCSLRRLQRIGANYLLCVAITYFLGTNNRGC